MPTDPTPDHDDVAALLDRELDDRDRCQQVLALYGKVAWDGDLDRSRSDSST